MANLESARSYFERAMLIDRSALNPAHPDLARDVNHLGLVLRELGDLEGERRLYVEARHAVIEAHGEQHRRARELNKRLEGAGHGVA